MIHVIAQLHWLGVLAAFVAYFLLGALWFTVFFSKPYRFSLGREKEAQSPTAAIFFVGPAVCSLVITIAHAVLMHLMNIDSYGGAVEFALLIGVGYLFANTVNIAINPNIPRPLLYGLISGAFHVTGILIVSVILVAMQ